MEKQGFKTIDAGLMLGLITLSVVVVVTILSQQTKDPDLERAYLGAENLTLQLVGGGLGNLQRKGPEGGRHPASVKKTTGYQSSLKLFGKQGKIGQDPWGNAYQFNFISNEKSSKVYVVVWSTGSNGQAETSEEDLEKLTAIKAFVQDVRLVGDDLGFIRSVEAIN